MKPEIEVIHVEEKIAKNGSRYRVIWVKIMFDGECYIRKLIRF